MRAGRGKSLGALAVVLAWLVPNTAYARCYAGDRVRTVGSDEFVAIAVALALAAVALGLMFLRARRRRAKGRGDGSDSDNEAT